MYFEYISKDDTFRRVDVDEAALRAFLKEKCAPLLVKEREKPTRNIYPKTVYDACEFGLKSITEVETGYNIDRVEFVACANGDCLILFYSSYDDYDLCQIDIDYDYNERTGKIEIYRNEFDEYEEE